MAETEIERAVNDAWDEPDTGKPPCDFCRREVPCECANGPCMCTCGRCEIADPDQMAHAAAVWRLFNGGPR